MRRRVDTTTMERALRKRYNVGGRKIPYEERDVAHSVITPDDDRGYVNVIGADDDDSLHAAPIGGNITYSVELTEEEAERFRRASNCRFVEEDQIDTVDEVTVTRATQTESTIPPPSTMTYMGAAFTGAQRDWHGRDVSIAVLDGGTTRAVKDRFNWSVVAQHDFVRGGESTDVITVEHGCYVTPEVVPANGRLVEAIVFDEGGVSRHSTVAAALRWAADNGAQVVNYSGSGRYGSETQSDAMTYLQERGVVLVCSAGNDGAHRLDYPAKLCQTFPNVKSSLAFVEATDVRADFSNHHETGSGCSPGSRCLSVNSAAENIRWSGTSSSSPKQALLVAMGCTGGRFTAVEVARALEVNARDTQESSAEEGAGAWHLENALRKLGAFDEPSPTPTPTPAPSPYDDLKKSLLTRACVKARIRRARYAAARVVAGGSFTARPTGLWVEDKERKPS